MKSNRLLHLTLMTAVALNLATASSDTIGVTAVSLRPNPPVMGNNALDLTVSDSSGNPVDGLKIGVAVAMTSMDMGTTHPLAKGSGKGHYKTTVMFSMEGPWRVTFSGSGTSGTFKKSFDFHPGSKKVWVMPLDKSQAVTDSTKPSAKILTRPPAEKVSPQITAPTVNSVLPKMAMPADTVKPAMNMVMAHEVSRVPQLVEKGVVKATAGMVLGSNAGFGINAPMVGMMNMMMVGGSGMEGMKMAPMDMIFNEATYSGTDGDSPMVDMVASTDSGDMSVGDMGTSSPFKVKATLEKAAVGDNIVKITVTSKEGKPVLGAKVTASVSMTSMDMGTTHPAVKETGKGHYTSKVNFGMQGPWKLTLNVATGKGKSSTYHFVFEAK